MGGTFSGRIGEVPLELQTKLLRVFKSGNSSDWKLATLGQHARLIAATNRDLEVW